MNKEEIEKAKEDLIFFNEGDYITREMDKSANILEDYIKQLEQENNKQNKMIDEMAGYMSNIMDCPLEVENIDLKCENKCGKITEQDCWKQYFEKKVEEK